MPVTQVGDVEIYYELQGSGAALPTVLLMGLGSDHHAWERLAPLLGGRPLLLIDNRGVGRSSKPRGRYTTAQLAADAVAVMDAVGWRRAHIIGVSLGGAIAQMLALDHPARVTSLTLIATFTELDAAMQKNADDGARKTGGVDMGQMLSAMMDSEAPIDPKAIFGFLMPLVFSEDFRKREKAWLRAQLERTLLSGEVVRGFAGQMAAAWSHKTRERLPSLATTPTLVMVPEKDKLVPPAQSRLLHAGIPGSRLVELRGGLHGCIIERADEVAAMLDGWLREHDPVQSAA